MVNVVVKEEAVRFTMLLPIKMALNIFVGSSINFCTVLAEFVPSSARLLILSLLTVVRAVSADEKKADSASNISKIINCVTSLGSKRSSPCSI